MQQRTVGVSVASLAAARRSAFSPGSSPLPSPSSSPATPLDVSANARLILSILGDIDQALPLRKLEQLVLTLLTHASSSPAVTLTAADYLTVLRSLTRRQLTCTRHLPQYLAQAAAKPPASSPYHPYHHEHAINASLPASSLPQLRRALFLLSWAMRVDMAVQGTGRGVGRPRMELAQRVLEHAGCRYMAARLKKQLARVHADEADIGAVEQLPPEIRSRWPHILKSSGDLRHMTADDARRLSVELEALSSGSTDLSDEEHMRLLLASLRAADEVSPTEVDALQPLLRVVAKKMEVNAEPERDRVMRWRVMGLLSSIQAHMRTHSVALTPLITDEVLRVYANCAALRPALALLDSLPSPDLLSFTYLFRCISLLQRWEEPEHHALALLERLRAAHAPTVAVYNDVLRALDRGERFDLIVRVVEEMRAQGLEGNDITWQYVGQAAAAAGEDEVAARLMGQEGKQAVEEDLAVVDAMTAADFFPDLDSAESAESVDVRETVAELKQRMKAELLQTVPMAGQT